MMRTINTKKFSMEPFLLKECKKPRLHLKAGFHIRSSPHNVYDDWLDRDRLDIVHFVIHWRPDVKDRV